MENGGWCMDLSGGDISLTKEEEKEIGSEFDRHLFKKARIFSNMSMVQRGSRWRIITSECHEVVEICCW